MGLLIGITGLARSGKDTVAKMMAEELYKQKRGLFILMAYAQELKLRVQKDFDLTYEQLWGTEKEFADERYRRPEWKHLGGGTMTHWTPREILQNYGEFYRTVDYGFWVKHLFKVIKDNNYKNVIITDIRYPNEADPIVDSGGYVIKINRENKDEITNKQHVSETAMNGYDKKFDFVINNNGTLDELQLAVKEAVLQIVVAENNKRRGVKKNG